MSATQASDPLPPTVLTCLGPRIVGIGASAGGLEAFTELLRSLPSDAAAAYVLVQHLDPTHRSLLTELLARTTTLPVREIVDQTRVEPNQIYVIPPNYDLTIEGGVLQLSRRKRNGGPARSIDRFLTSLAADQKERAIGVILSGAGSDGAQGLNAIKQAGGLTFAQEPGSAKYDSMPRAAINTGCVDFVLAPEKIAEEIGGVIHKPGRTKSRAAANAKRRRQLGSAVRRFGPPKGPGASWPGAPEDASLRKLFLVLRSRTGVDFSYYKPNTIRRRLNRRLTIHKLTGLPAYLRYLREHPNEMEAVFQDLLINVTSFFRNPSVFEALTRRVFPKLIKGHQEGDTLRIWVAGCSTGQEVYSLAMAYTEFAEENPVGVPVQIFGTDVNGSLLEQARSGRYTRQELEGMSPSRLQRFFSEEEGQYRVQKRIRDLVIFAQHNLISDPPFTRVDMISCRNVLIYFDAALQQKILPTFHYALKPNGLLLLGASETIGSFGNLFTAFDKARRIYLKKPAASWLHLERPPKLPAGEGQPSPTPARGPSAELRVLDAQKEADRLTLAKYAPVSVLISEDGEILQFRGEVGRYLVLPSGKASFQLFRMAREGLGLPLQKLLQRAKRENKVVRERGLRFEGRRRMVDIEVVPLKNLKSRYYLVLFEKTARPALGARSNSAASRRVRAANERGQGVELRHELEETREHLRSLQEEHETAVEELQASNEEVQSSNEELQSLNEELETSNEELESANEELTTLNEELATRNSELRESERRLREQAELLELAPVLARSPRDRIIFWNRGAENLYGFTKEEALGQTSYLLLSTQFPQPLEKIQAILHQQGHWEGELSHRRKDGSTICVASQWLVHHDEQKKLRAILQVDTDITRRIQAEKALVESEAFNRSILESSPDWINVLDREGHVLLVHGTAVPELMASPHPDVAAPWPEFWAGEGRGLAETALATAWAGRTGRFQSICPIPAGKDRWWDVVVRPVIDAAGKPERLVAVARDISEQKRAEMAAHERALLSALRGDIALTIAQSGDLEPALQQMATAMSTHLHLASVRIWVLADGDDMLQLSARAGAAAPPSWDQPRITLGEGLIGDLAVRREPWLENDPARLEQWLDPRCVAEQGAVSLAAFPLVSAHRVVGAILLVGRQRFETAVVKELELSSERIAQFIDRKHVEQDNVRLHDQAARARGEIEILNEIGSRIAAELDLDRLTQAVTDAATRLTRAEFGLFIYESIEEGGEKRRRHTVSGVASAAFSSFSVPADSALFARTFAGREVVRFVDATTDQQFPRSPSESGLPPELTVRSYLAVPIISRLGEVIGALAFGHSQPGVFTGREERVIVGLAAQASVAMDNARLFDQLERKVRERTVRLEETVSELQAFSYTVSHDLRAPLRAMQSYAQILQEDYADRLDEAGRSYLARIERAGMRLDTLIQDVLTYSRTSRAEIALRPVDLGKLVTDIIQQYPNLQAPAADIQVLGELPIVLAEDSSATQCFSNLLGNSVKFVRPGDHPRVRLRAEERSSTFRIWVEDSGIGISPEHHERVFRMFERVETNHNYEGTGIGLAIVRKAMERLGGQVGLESALGEGSRFWLEFRKP